MCQFNLITKSGPVKYRSFLSGIKEIVKNSIFLYRNRPTRVILLIAYSKVRINMILLSAMKIIDETYSNFF